MLNIENLDEQPQWRKLLRKNILNNRQLDFTGNMFVSCVTEEGEVECEMLKLRHVSKNSKLIFATDGRSNFFSKVRNAKKVCINVYFPLSKEKMKFYGKLEIFNVESEENGLEIVNEIWSQKLDKEERKMYKEASPDKIVIEKDDMNTFNTPEVGNIPKNFVIFVVESYKGKILYLMVS